MLTGMTERDWSIVFSSASSTDAAAGWWRLAMQCRSCHGPRMVTYEVTSTGPQGYQVTAISPEFQGAVVGDFSSLQAAETFAHSMREIDAAGSHSVAST